ncbi:MAG: prolyl oligopeptidase family serine peptidase, partial [Myxococcota bacterium]
PVTRRDASAVDTYFGTQVPDPYRWLEDPDSAETAAWVAAQNDVTSAWLAQVPQRGAIRDRLTALWNHERYGMPRKQAGKYLFEHNDGLQNQNELLVADAVTGEPRVALDANTFSADGTVPLASWGLSEDGRYLVYGTSDGGSDWNTLKVRDLAAGTDLPDTIAWVKFSEAAWSKDSAGFYYARYPEPKPGEEDAALANQAVYYHRLGTAQADDAKVLDTPDQPQFGYDFAVTDDGAFLVATVWQGSEERSRIWVRPAAGGPSVPWTRLLDAFDAMYAYVDHDGDKFWFWTDNGAPKGRLIEVDLRHPEPAAWKTVLPEGDDLLQRVGAVGDRLFATYLHDAHSVVRMFDRAGAPAGEVSLPGIGTVDGFDGEATDTETFFTFTSFTQPTQVFRYDLATDRVELFREPKVAFDPAAYTTEQVFVTSKDGTKLPMFVVHRKDLVLDGRQPTLLYGYGGFNIPSTPTFAVPNLVWLELGGVYAVANLRGGGEYGRDWHEAGTKLRKQNVFDDFIAAAEWLIGNGYTAPDRLAIHGRSNGGLLVGATLVQRPDLFGAALPAVGVMDMLKYHTWTIGWGWAADYGTSADSPEMFQALGAYSPVHNCRDAAYPPTMVLTADHDDRVVPGHSFKFAAALQHAQQGSAPILARIDTRAGHGAGKSIAMQIDERADMLAFLVRSLKMDGTIRP